MSDINVQYPLGSGFFDASEIRPPRHIVIDAEWFVPPRQGANVLMTHQNITGMQYYASLIKQGDAVILAAKDAETANLAEAFFDHWNARQGLQKIHGKAKVHLINAVIGQSFDAIVTNDPKAFKGVQAQDIVSFQDGNFTQRVLAVA